ncbi:MAG: D-malate dehydrogenase [decarboxylating], partial [uncultured Thermomicrobiales bacterium]
VKEVSDRGHSRRRHRPGGHPRGAPRPRPARGALRRRSRLLLRVVPVGLRALPQDGPDDGQGWSRPAGELRRDLLRCGRLAGRPGSRQPLGVAAGDLPGFRPVRLHPPGPVA